MSWCRKLATLAHFSLFRADCPSTQQKTAKEAENQEEGEAQKSAFIAFCSALINRGICVDYF